jgi:ABC-2 type transport system permease protein
MTSCEDGIGIMRTDKGRFGEKLRIVWAITLKDITDAAKNRTAITIFLSALFVVVMYHYLPVFDQEDERTNLLVYDAGSSSLLAALEESIQLDVYTYPSQEKMEHYLANGEVPELGLVIPPDFDQALQAGEPLVLEGAVLHWVSESDANELRALVEQEIGDLLEKPVHIDLEGNRVYPYADSAGYPFLTAFALVYVTLMVGLPLVPNLMLEEKQSKTLDALLVSPANSSQIVLGKALTGWFYTLISIGVVFAFNWALVTHWGLVLLATVCGAALGVALGLLLGSVFETRQQLTLWAWVLIAPLLLPVFLSMMRGLLPDGVLAVMHWIPTVALTRAVRVSFSDAAPLAQFGPELALVAGCAVLVYALVAWIVRRSDR